MDSTTIVSKIRTFKCNRVVSKSIISNLPTPICKKVLEIYPIGNYPVVPTNILFEETLEVIITYMENELNIPSKTVDYMIATKRRLNMLIDYIKSLDYDAATTQDIKDSITSGIPYMKDGKVEVIVNPTILTLAREGLLDSKYGEVYNDFTDMEKSRMLEMTGDMNISTFTCILEESYVDTLADIVTTINKELNRISENPNNESIPILSPSLIIQNESWAIKFYKLIGLIILNRSTIEQL